MCGDRVFNAGMRGRKTSEYDGGHRVPLFVYWPAGGLVGGRNIEPITAHVDVVSTDQYEIRLRRWPAEIDTAIDAPLPRGDDVPGEDPFRATPGDAVQAVKAVVRIGNVTAEAPIDPGAKKVVLEMTLPAGKTQMTAHFTTRDGRTVGAFYAYVTKR